MKFSADSVVLTGASGGLGQAMATALGGLCKNLLLVGRDSKSLHTLQRRLQAAHPALNAALVAGDLSTESTRQRIFSAAQAFSAPLNLLINNAGINEFREFGMQTSESTERLIAVNLLAPIHLTRLLLPLLKPAPRAQIVNVGSIMGYLGYPGFAVYSASKFGLRGFSQSLRRELADTGIEVRYFAPRSTRTSLNTPAVTAMNRELGTHEDSPEAVARMLLAFLGNSAWEVKIGCPERLFVLVNQLIPAVVDKAIRGKLETIKKHLRRA